MFIDSVYWIALRYPRDKWHKKAKGTTQYISKLPNIYFTEAIITETVNFLLRKPTHFFAHEVEIYTHNGKKYEKIGHFNHGDMIVSKMPEFSNLIISEENIFQQS